MEMFCKTEIKNYWLEIVRLLLIFTLGTLLFSCSSSNDKKHAGSEIRINLVADKDINPNDRGHPAPLNIFIYNIQERDVFTNADFFEIVNGNNKSLQTAISKEYGAILLPGESRNVTIKPDGDITTLGFIGAYRDLNDAIWLAIWTRPEKEKSWWRNMFSNDSMTLQAHFQKKAIIIKQMD
ncbi:type VI secretion system lipoprotein TssJ [Enterobacter asburiae]|uniref:type VI secretion system lipoprotein TssJ n=1 Tax=Enterobacter asburiae TaxID=61645 RepID=UPI00287AF901|nr:type VI secretion system lipoprotein TssJ [Enterobacter asburiae]MDS1916265.1 type VI secretion system lipoprotein TssJ [Enterobacter asburiae]